MYPERTGPTLDPTGDPRVDQAIAGLSALDDLNLDERPAALEAVHDRLREILGELGELGELGDVGQPGRRGEQGELGAGGRR